MAVPGPRTSAELERFLLNLTSSVAGKYYASQKPTGKFSEKLTWMDCVRIVAKTAKMKFSDLTIGVQGVKMKKNSQGVRPWQIILLALRSGVDFKNRLFGEFTFAQYLMITNAKLLECFVLNVPFTGSKIEFDAEYCRKLNQEKQNYRILTGQRW
jgi:hypothetical protein